MENRLEHLNQVNDVPVHSVLDPEFASYGRVVTGLSLIHIYTASSSGTNG